MAEEETKPQGGETPPPAKTFTQAELDAHIKDRLTREREKFADYETLKQAADKLKALEDSQKTELQKLADQAAEAERKATEKEAALTAKDKELAQERLMRKVVSAASAAGANDPSDANILAATASIDPAGANAEAEINAAIETIKKAKPYLFKAGTNRLESFNPGTGDGAPETDAKRRARLYGGGGQVLDASWAKAHGGGVFTSQPPEAPIPKP